MPVKKLKPTTPGTRTAAWLSYADLDKKEPEPSLIRPAKKHAGRNAQGRVTVRHRGGGNKRMYRIIDFKRDKKGIPAKVVAKEYDPNRSAHIALVVYADGEKRYILAPQGLNVGDQVQSGEGADIKVGNAIPLRLIPSGTLVHNIELSPGKGGQIVRSAGSAAQVLAREDKYVLVRLPSGEMRRILGDCFATIGAVSNPDHKNVRLGKAGKMRHRGRRPAVRGVAMSPRDHPHGGGEGRSPIGMPGPKSPWGKRTLGKKTRRHKKPGSHLILSWRK